MEDTFKLIIKEAVSPRFGPLKKSCTNALEVLNNKEIQQKIEVFQLRQKCITPLLMALETKNIRLCSIAVGAFQKLVDDERLRSQREDEEEKWMASQILHTLSLTPSLPDETQIEIFKMLLSITISAEWLTNPVIMVKLLELSIKVYNSVGESSVKTAVKATLTQLFTTMTEEVLAVRTHQSLANGVTGSVEEYEKSVLPVFCHLCEKLTSNNNKPAKEMLLESLYAILYKTPDVLRDNDTFNTMIWKELCPSLVYLLGNPVSDKTISTSSKRSNVQDSDLGRGSGCSAAAPSLNTAAASTIYNISVELVRLVGGIQSLRPVLESVFHRMLLYPPPLHRQDAIRVVRKVLGKPERLVDLAGPTLNDSTHTKASSSSKKNTYQDIALLKLIIDSMVECSKSTEESMALTVVQAAYDLIKCMERLIKGDGLSDLIVQEVHRQYKDDPSAAGDVYDLDGDAEVAGDISENVAEAEDNSNEDSSDDEEEPATQEELKGVHISQYVESSSDDEFEKGKMRELMNGAGITGPRETECEDERAYHKQLMTDKTQLLEEAERQNAKSFISHLKHLLPSLLLCVYWEEVDEMVLRFASSVATEVNEKSAGEQMSALNADGVYLATYYSLLVNLKLVTCGYYHSEEKSLPITQDQFIDELLSTDLLLYLTPTWLTEVYQHIIHFNLLGDAGYLPHAHLHQPALIIMLSELDGLGSNKTGSQMLTQYQQHLTEPISPRRCAPSSNTVYTAKLTAGMKLCSRMLRVCWSGILAILSSQLGGKSSSNITESISSLLGNKDEATHRQIISSSLEGLCSAAQLACTLGLHDLCGAVFFQLARSSCIVEESKKGEDKKPLCLQATHALCLDVVLKMGLEIGSHSPDCWKHIFRCCGHISEFEHLCFSSGFYDKYLPKVYQEQNTQDQCDLTMDSLYPQDMGVEYESMLQSEPVLPRTDVTSIVRQSMEEGGEHSIMATGALTPQDTSRALFSLSQQVDKLFEDAAAQLNMKALQSFLRELCISSALQLRGNTKIERYTGTSALHLYRLGDVLLRVLRNGRPLLHLVTIWNIVSPYLIQAACHRDHNISKKSVSCIHEFVTSVVQVHDELPYSHFNEMFIKPLESLLSLDLCNGDVQDQVVCCICELVEACASQIKSGWRPLFGALRSIKIEYTTDEDVNEARKNHIAAVLDVFDVFLNTDNVIVFSNAAIDCILCLLKYVKGPGEFCSDENVGDSDSEDEGGIEMLCQPALQYLQQFCSFLSNMYNMPACPVFHDANRIQTSHILQSVDPVIPAMDMLSYQQPFLRQAYLVSSEGKKDEQSDNQAKTDKSDVQVSNPELATSDEDTDVVPENPMNQYILEEPALAEKTAFSKLCRTFKEYSVRSLDEVDKHTGVLHVWFLVLEGLVDAVETGPKTVQPQILNTLFDLLRAAAHVTAQEGRWSLSMYSINHLVLPMLQSWLRKAAQNAHFWQVTMTNFKQFVGLTTDLIVDFLIQFTSCREEKPMIGFMLKSLLDVLTECIAQPNEAVSRLACSCFRHLLLSTGPILSEDLWQVAVLSLENAMQVTMYNLRLLMTPFQANSSNFYGDLGHVKIGVRKDCSAVEAERLRQLAQQVFLLDGQKASNNSTVNYNVEEQPSFIFLIYPPSIDGTDPNELLTRVPFRNIVEGLVCHQMLLHTVGCIMLQGSTTKLPLEADVIPEPTTDTSTGSHPKKKLPGLMQHMSSRNIMHLLNCLYNSYNTAKQFDERPGLKFLIQKVAGADVAANLYKQAGLSATFYIHTVFEICSSQENISINNTHMMLAHFKDCTFGKRTMYLTQDYEKASDSVDKIFNHIQLFMCLFKEILDEVCQTYVNFMIDAEGPQRDDHLNQQVLVFLLAPTEELPQLKREKSISEMVAEKLKALNDERGKDEIPLDAIPTTFDNVTKQEEQVSGACSTGSSEPQSPKHQDKTSGKPTDQPEKVYTVASNDTINNLMTQYKKHKQAKTMPQFVKAQRSKPAPVKKTLPPNADPVDVQIHQQQHNSILKDSEACLQCWMEVLVNVLKLYEQLPESHYQALLPAAFSCFNQLVCYSTHTVLREALSHWIHHIGSLYGLAPHGMAKPMSRLKNNTLFPSGRSKVVLK